MNTQPPETKIPALILAAGNSSRMGQPKQLLLYQNQPLLRRAAQTALAANCFPVLIILGASATEITPTLEDLPIQILLNPDWQKGMGTSLRTGITHLLQLPILPDAVLLMLCDQPLITPAHLENMIANHRASKKPITAAAYHQTLGVPAIFSQKFFAELNSLPDQTGAKSLLTRHPNEITSFPLPEAATDVDDPLAYERLN